MDIYQSIHPILLERTPFLFVKSKLYEIYNDIKTDDLFATLECKNKQITITIVEFIDWKSIHILMNLGRYILYNFKDYDIESIMFEYSDDMSEELIYDYRMNIRPWYAWFGYIPYFKFWNYSKLKDFYQLPFLKPKDFLNLSYGKKLIHPSQIILEKRKHPLHLIAQKDPNDFQLRLLPPSSFYSVSKRPITSMSQLRQDKFQVLDLSKVSKEILETGAPFKIGEDFFIPVVRYSNGMRNGCYFESSDVHQFFGTFYYWEPESKCYLNMGKKFGYFESKFDCAIEIMYKLEQMDEITGGENKEIQRLFMRLDKYIHKILNEMTNIFKDNCEEYIIFENHVTRSNDTESLDKLIQEEIISIYQGKIPQYIPIDLHYKSTVSGKYMKNLFYAAEDELDQALAMALIYIGYDVVVLGRMAGMYRVVTEVMDVRKREESLYHLCWSIL
jgi:hypothetical protein